jgi:hypothetical protein
MAGGAGKKRCKILLVRSNSSRPIPELNLSASANSA